MQSSTSLTRTSKVSLQSGAPRIAVEKVRREKIVALMSIIACGVGDLMSDIGILVNSRWSELGITLYEYQSRAKRSVRLGLMIEISVGMDGVHDCAIGPKRPLCQLSRLTCPEPNTWQCTHS